MTLLLFLLPPTLAADQGGDDLSWTVEPTCPEQPGRRYDIPLPIRAVPGQVDPTPFQDDATTKRLLESLAEFAGDGSITLSIQGRASRDEYPLGVLYEAFPRALPNDAAAIEAGIDEHRAYGRAQTLEAALWMKQPGWTYLIRPPETGAETAGVSVVACRRDLGGGPPPVPPVPHFPPHVYFSPDHTTPMRIPLQVGVSPLSQVTSTVGDLAAAVEPATEPTFGFGVGSDGDVPFSSVFAFSLPLDAFLRDSESRPDFADFTVNLPVSESSPPVVGVRSRIDFTATGAAHLRGAEKEARTALDQASETFTRGVNEAIARGAIQPGVGDSCDRALTWTASPADDERCDAALGDHPSNDAGVDLVTLLTEWRRARDGLQTAMETAEKGDGRFFGADLRADIPAPGGGVPGGASAAAAGGFSAPIGQDDPAIRWFARGSAGAGLGSMATGGPSVEAASGVGTFRPGEEHIGGELEVSGGWNPRGGGAAGATLRARVKGFGSLSGSVRYAVSGGETPWSYAVTWSVVPGLDVL